MRYLAAAVLACIAFFANASPAVLSFEPDTPHYFENFDPDQKPWHPGQALNIEEVFKNYQYFEIRFLKRANEIEVRRYIQNQRDRAERYRILPDGALDKISE
ncbi:MAG: hypothetical protein ABIG70_05430 [Pseudomonadota bacterium]